MTINTKSKIKNQANINMTSNLIKIMILALILSIIGILFPAQGVEAASFTISKSSITLDIGKSSSITINAPTHTGRLDIISSNSSVAAINSNNLWVENTSQTITISAKSTGTATITIKGEVYDSAIEEEKIYTKTIMVTVNKPVTPETGSTGGNASNNQTTKPGGDTSNNQTTTKPGGDTSNNQTTTKPEGNTSNNQNNSNSGNTSSGTQGSTTTNKPSTSKPTNNSGATTSKPTQATPSVSKPSTTSKPSNQVSQNQSGNISKPKEETNITNNEIINQEEQIKSETELQQIQDEVITEEENKETIESIVENSIEEQKENNLEKEQTNKDKNKMSIFILTISITGIIVIALIIVMKKHI